MYKKFISAFQMLNILFQAIYCLAFPMGLGALISFLVTKFLGAPKWIWAILLSLGAFMGLYSMIKYTLAATKALENLDKNRDEREIAERERNERRERWKNGETE
jgi:F0F1-type ATP synthase assembly protein I